MLRRTETAMRQPLLDALTVADNRGVALFAMLD